MVAKQYAAKIARRAQHDVLVLGGEIKTKQYLVDDFFGVDYAATTAGTFHNLDRIHLRWTKPDWFEYVPDAEAPFSFTRASGEVITPGRMLTDGGSIPRGLWVKEELSPWGYAPAFLVHDWEFDRHHMSASQKAFEDVRDTLAEGLKTLMETGVCPKAERVFRAIYAGVNSWIAKQIWDGAK